MDVQLITEFGPVETIPENIVFSDHLSPTAIEHILNAINKSQYRAKIFGGIPELISAYDYVHPLDLSCLYLNISNGMNQPSRRMQAPLLCELLNMKYSGSAPSTVALMNNKHFCKKAIEYLVNIPKDVLVRQPKIGLKGLNLFNRFPALVKPNCEGGSIGISQKNIVFNFKDMSDRVNSLLKKFEEVLVEEFISGIELTNLVIGNDENFVLNEIVVYKTYGSFYTDKTIRDDTVKTQGLSEMFMIEEVISNKQIINLIKETTENIFCHLGCRDIARVDYKLTKEKELYFLEINSNPNLYTKNIDVICSSLNISFSEFLCLLIEASMKRNKIPFTHGIL